MLVGVLTTCSHLAPRGRSRMFPLKNLCIFHPGTPLTYFNDGVVRMIFLGSEILAKSDFFGSKKDARIFLCCKKNRGIFLGCKKKRTKGFFGVCYKM